MPAEIKNIPALRYFGTLAALGSSSHAVPCLNSHYSCISNVFPEGSVECERKQHDSGKRV